MKSNMRITMNDLDRGMLQHNKLPDLALDKLMEWMMSGKLSMGDKLNTEELASQLGCLPKMIQDYEEGKLYPHAITMVDIADFFNVSLDYLMGRTECREINKG